MTLSLSPLARFAALGLVHLTATIAYGQEVCSLKMPLAGLRCEVWVSLAPPVSVEEAVDLACRHGMQIQTLQTTFPPPPDGLPAHASFLLRPGVSADSLRREWTASYLHNMTHGKDWIIEKWRNPSAVVDSALRVAYARAADQMEANVAWAHKLDPEAVAADLKAERISGVVYGRAGLQQELGDEAVGGLCLPWINVWPFSTIDP